MARVSEKRVSAPGPFRADQIPEGAPYELSNGHPVLCLPTGRRGGLSNLIGGEVLETDPAVKAAGVDVGFSKDPTHLRAPDVSVGDFANEPGWAPDAPPLAVEYADTGQDESELQRKIEELLAAGIPVGIATDSPASTPSFDIFEELRTAIVAARARAGRPDALSAAQALELATLGGARVLGLEGQVGSLVPGKLADLAVVSLDGSPFDPVEDPATAVVLGGSPDRVAATLVHGEDRYRRGTTAWPDSRRAARRARSRMLP